MRNPPPAAKIVCDGAIGTCSDFMAATLGAFQEGVGVILAGRGVRPTTACIAERYACCPPGGCSSSSDSFMITPDAYTASGSFTNIVSNAMVFGGCTLENSCSSFGQLHLDRPGAGTILGSKIIGRNSCIRVSGYLNLEKNICSIIRAENKACNGIRSCIDLGSHCNQSVSSPVIVDIIIGEGVCQGFRSCEDAHKGNSKIRESLFIGTDACVSQDACDGVANSDISANDLVIPGGRCVTIFSYEVCVATDMRSGNTALTCTIGCPLLDCPAPNPLACFEIIAAIMDSVEGCGKQWLN